MTMPRRVPAEGKPAAVDDELDVGERQDVGRHEARHAFVQEPGAGAELEHVAGAGRHGLGEGAYHSS